MNDKILSAKERKEKWLARQTARTEKELAIDNKAKNIGLEKIWTHNTTIDYLKWFGHLPLEDFDQIISRLMDA